MPRKPPQATITLKLDRNVKLAAQGYARQRHQRLAEVLIALLHQYIAACARENEAAAQDLFGDRPPQFRTDDFRVDDGAARRH